MQIALTHQYYRLFQQDEKTLSLRGDHQVETLHTGPVLASGVALSGFLIICAALVNETTIKYWYGEKTFRSQEIAVTNGVVRGLKLVTDALGVSHLFYLVYQQEFKQGATTLFHQTFQNNSWTPPVRVTANIEGYKDSWQVCFDQDNYLHLVYLNPEKDTLLYRAFDLKEKVWSGAAALVQEECESPQIYAGVHGLVILWISCEDTRRRLKLIHRVTTWGKPSLVSPPAGAVYHAAFNFSSEWPAIMWLDEGALWQVDYRDGHWSPPKAMPKEDFTYCTQIVIANRGKGSCAYVQFRPEKIHVPHVPPPVPEIPDFVVVEKKITAGVLAQIEPRVLRLQREIDSLFPKFEAEISAQTEKAARQGQRYRAMEQQYRAVEQQIKSLETKVLLLEASLKQAVREMKEKKQAETKQKSIWQKILARL